MSLYVHADTITFMTYNLEADRWLELNFQSSRISRHAQVISAAGADVVSVQEIEGNANFNKLKTETGLAGSWFDIANNGYGIGVLWNPSLGTPQITNVKINPGPESSDPDASRAYIIAEFEDFCFISTHYSLDAVDRDSMTASIIAFANQVGKTVFVGGDLNAEPTFRALQTFQNNNFKVLNSLTDITYTTDNPTVLIDLILGFRKTSANKSYSVLSRGIPTAPQGVVYAEISDHFPYCVMVQLSDHETTVTNGNASGPGSFSDAFMNALDGDEINFHFDGTVCLIEDAFALNNITINGLNTYNNEKVIIKQTTAGKNFFTLGAGKTAQLSNIVFDGSAGANKICITAVNGSTILIDSCVFRNINSGTDNGSAGRFQGVIRISNSRFENNTCGGTYGGGALCIYNAADAIIDKCTFVGNSSTGGGNRGGGAIVVRGTVDTGPCNVLITNSTFANNSATGKGGAVMSSVQSSSGSAFVADVTAINCTFTGNQGDGAVAAFTNVKGTSKLNLINCLVANNIDMVGTSYSDLTETKGEDSEGSAEVTVSNVIYAAASESIDMTDKNCIKVSDPATADLFKTLETFATDKKRPVLTETMGHKVAEISSTGIAVAAGVVTLTGYTIPTVDQLGADRPAIPSIGAVEVIVASKVVEPDESNIKIIVKNKLISISGIENESILKVYGITGKLFYKSVVTNNQHINLEQITDKLVILQVAGKSFKVLIE